MKQKLAIGLAGAPGLLGCARREHADRVLYDSKVLTVGKAFSIKSAIVAGDGPVRALGDYGLAGRYDTPVRIGLKGREATKGSLEPGNYGDFSACERDLLTSPPKQLLTMKVDLTFIGGRQVYAGAAR